MWIPITITAAAFQTARTALQHRLRALLSVSGAGFVRYVYGAPLSAAAVAAFWTLGMRLPSAGRGFVPMVLIGGIAQIAGTICLIRAFDSRDFAVGTVLAKTEVVQVAIFSWVLLAEPLDSLGWAGAAACTLGVVLLASSGARLRPSLLREPAAWYGLAAGGLFGIAAIGIRTAAGSLDGGTVVVRALVTLAAMNTAQTVLHGGYLAVRDREQLRLAAVHWRSSSLVGLLSVCGSAGWAIALTLESAAKVRTLGQVELVFAFLVSHRLLGERHRREELLAAVLVVCGVVLVVVAG